MDHEFDGIQEYDNPIPLWLNLILFGTVIFSVFYYLYFQIGPLLGTSGWTVVEAYESAKAENLRLRFAEIGELQGDEATLIRVPAAGEPGVAGRRADGLPNPLPILPCANGSGLGRTELDRRPLQERRDNWAIWSR
jgi:hypothetical protein